MGSNFSIAGRLIGVDYTPFIIAEMSGNHNQSLDRALSLVDAAAKSGAHAIKLQTYTADTITMPGAYTINDESSIWNGRGLHELYKQAYTPWDWHEPIFEHANKLGLIAFSSPFDETAVDFLETLDVPAYKIASFENEHYPLIKKVIETGKPFIVSTGVIERSDLDETVRYIRSLGADNFALLKCTSTYPAAPDNTNLRAIPAMANRYDCTVGLSDHTMGIGASVASIAFGASVIEKHFTIRRDDGGVDSAFSLEPEELKALVVETDRAWRALGKVVYELSEAEMKQAEMKRSIFATKDMPKGHIVGPLDIKVVRPALGLHPRYFEQILGKALTSPALKGQPLKEEHFDYAPKIID